MSDTVTIVLDGHWHIRDYQRALALLPSIAGEEAKRAADALRRALLRGQAKAGRVAKSNCSVDVHSRLDEDRAHRRAKARAVRLAALHAALNGGRCPPRREGLRDDRTRAVGQSIAAPLEAQPVSCPVPGRTTMVPLAVATLHIRGNVAGGHRAVDTVACSAFVWIPERRAVIQPT